MIVNLTPYAVTVIPSCRVLEPCTTPPRILTNSLGWLKLESEGVYYRTTCSRIYDLPEEADGVKYVVEDDIANAFNRRDFLNLRFNDGWYVYEED